MNKKSLIAVIVVMAVIGVALLSQLPNNALNAAQPASTIAAENLAVSGETPVADEMVKADATTLAPALDHADLTGAPLAGDYVMGEATAPVTLVEYASLSCPHCADFHKDVLPQLKKNYIDTGKLRYVLRQFPINESAMAGAMLVHCMGEKGGAERYYQFNQVLFDAQSKWAFDANFKQSLSVFAEVGGVTPAEFDACLTDMNREKNILLTRKVASEELKIDGTPFLYVNAHPHTGNKSFAALQQEIDALLAQAGK